MRLLIASGVKMSFSQTRELLLLRVNGNFNNYSLFFTLRQILNK